MFTGFKINIFSELGCAVLKNIFLKLKHTLNYGVVFSHTLFKKRFYLSILLFAHSQISCAMC
jgi:hypothetical protein